MIKFGSAVVFPMCLGVALCTAMLCLFVSGVASASTFVVDDTSDLADVIPGNGSCNASGIRGSKCTLRAAIQEANARPGSHVIQVPAGLYILTISGIDEDHAATGDLDLTGSIDLVGSPKAPGDVVIDAKGLDDRVFHVHGRGPHRIRGVTIRNGNATSSCANKCVGGGILNESDDLELLDAVVYQNRAPYGAGINSYSNSGMTIERTLVMANLAGTNGGGVSSSGTLRLVDSWIIENEAPGGGGGLQISAATGPTTVLRTTFSENYSPVSSGYGDGKGAAVELLGSSGFVMVNSTVSGNDTAGSGAAFYFSSATAILRNVTITDNHGNSDEDGIGQSGGLYLNGICDVRLENTVLTGNRHGTRFLDCYGAIEGLSSGGYNLIGNCSMTTSTGDITGEDPLFAVLSDNGGFGDTHLPQAGSPLIDAGNPGGCLDETGSSLLEVDQTGYTRHTDGDDNGVVRCDIGAVETVPEPGSALAALVSLLTLAWIAKAKPRS